MDGQKFGPDARFTSNVPKECVFRPGHRELIDEFMALVQETSAAMRPIKAKLTAISARREALIKAEDGLPGDEAGGYLLAGHRNLRMGLLKAAGQAVFDGDEARAEELFLSEVLDQIDLAIPTGRLDNLMELVTAFVRVFKSPARMELATPAAPTKA